MAMALATEFELITLWIRLLPQRGEPAVHCRLEATVDGQRRDLFEAGPFPASEFGLPSPGTTWSDTTLGVAPELVRQLQDWNSDQNEEQRPLWICIIPPYGYLGMIPWEADLVPALGVPVLRLPDFLEPQRETSIALDVAVISSVPRGVGKGEIGTPELERLVRALLDSSPERRVLVHVFADEGALGRLDADIADSVTVHELRSKRARKDDRPGVNPWFEWVEAAMAGQALDAVHFLAHGILGSGGGLLALGRSPELPDATGGVYSNAAQVAEFLTRTGAWSAGFHLPQRRETDLGLRNLADAIGVRRPGSVLFHDSSADRDALEPALRLMYGPAPQLAAPLPGTFIFIQPRQVLGAGERSDGDPRTRSIRRAPGRAWEGDLPDGYADLFDGQTIPSYVAATERLGDQAQLILNRGIDTASGRPLGDEESEALTKAMGALKNAVANYAMESQANAAVRTKRRGRLP